MNKTAHPPPPIMPCGNERIISYENAKQFWSDEVNRLGVQAKLHWHGHGQYRTAFCHLEREGQRVALGAGKGITQNQVELGSCYEALENYLSSHHFCSREIILAATDEISKSYEIPTVRFRESLLQTNQEILPWIITTEYNSKLQHAVPLATVDLTYYKYILPNDTCDYHQHHVYSSTNGLAIGANYQEALLHALSEIIERDAISYFLLESFLLKTNIRKVNHHSLPEYLQDLIKQLEKNYHSEILLVHLPSRFNLPVYGAVIRNSKTTQSFKGFGASLYANYAAERAILEALQTMHGFEYMPENTVDINNTRIKQYPVLQDCFHFDLFDLINKNQFEIVDFDADLQSHNNLSLEQYLKILITKIYEHHSKILIDKVAVSENGLTCLNVLVPGTEEFFHVFNGEIILPQPETKSYILARQNSIK